MKNTIKEITLMSNSSNQPIEVGQTSTLITGFSGKGKTLLFKLIVFVLGDDTNVDIDEARKHYGNLDKISIRFSSGTVLTRFFEKEFKAEVTELDGQSKIFDNKAEYRERVGRLFNHKNVKIITNEKKSTQKSFTMPEYISTLFFSESRIAEEKTLIETEGRTNEVKLTNYYKYFITGDIIDEKLASEDKTKKKEDSEVESVIKFLAKKAKTTTPNAQKKLKELKKKHEKNLHRIQQIEDNIKIKKSDIRQLMVEKSKFASLISLYQSQLAELNCAHILDDHMASSCFRCDNCKEIIQWNVDDVGEQIGLLQFRINQIEKTSQQIENEIKKVHTEIDNLKEEGETLISENEVLNEKIGIIENELHDQIAYELARKSLLSSRQSSLEQRAEILDSERTRINNLFCEEVEKLCNKIGERLDTWGIVSKNNVTFDQEKFDFRFSGTLRPYLAKGYKTFCTVAMILELMLHMKKVGVPCFDFILIDTVWKVASFEFEDIDSVILNFMNDISNCGIQTIIFENESPKKISSNFKNIVLK